ncbi:MAG TPA: NUDIX domain-containing protein [Chloroflexota bacterium]|nr:NUDIX domain-containing protein [Chloroflexota bacterium]HUM70424.1 NUDIX domain-containing protein [Chloroflexota bacterium]
MATILCHDISGDVFPVAPEALFFRPAVYGIFIENSQVLLQKHPQTQRWHPPGSVLAVNETPTQAARHVFRRLTGMTPRVGAMLYMEDQYVMDSERRAWQLSVVYYALERPSTAATISDTSKVEWLSLNELDRSQMQFGYEAVQAGRLQLKL